MKSLFKIPETRVVNIKHGFPYDVYIGRGFCPSTGKKGIWGNPYSHKEGTLAKYKVSSIAEAIEKYREYVLSNEVLMSRLHELKGMTLGCWCVSRNHKRRDDISKYKCHGEVLLDLIDEFVK